MFYLYSLPTHHLLAIIGDGDVRFLINDPGDTAHDHRSFHYDAAELDDLAARGGDPGLIRLLRAHLGDGDRAAVCWGARQEERLMTPEELEELLPAWEPEPPR